MKVLMISKALVSAAYHSKLERLSSEPDVELTLLVPDRWGKTRLEKESASGYRIIPRKVALSGYNHLHWYPGLFRLIRDLRPDIVHIDEEHYSFVTFQATRASKAVGAKVLFFTWQNIEKKYPPPFSLFEKYNFENVSCAIAGSGSAREVLIAKGFRRDIYVIPQFGVEPAFYSSPRDGKTEEPRKGGKFVIGFIGRLVWEKGLLDLVDALEKIGGNTSLLIVGEGSLKKKLLRRAERLGLSERIHFVGTVPSQEVPGMLLRMNCLVLPSRTTSAWKEQFGRVIVEAMAAGVPVIGSDSGEIPSVVGEAGLIFAEGRPDILAEKIRVLMDNPALREKLRVLGRRRVNERFTSLIIARKTLEVYRKLMDETS